MLVLFSGDSVCVGGWLVCGGSLADYLVPGEVSQVALVVQWSPTEDGGSCTEFSTVRCHGSVEVAFLEVTPRGFYIRLKHARNTPPCPHVTSPELEGLSLLREQLLATARATLHNLKQPQSRTTVLPLTKHGWKCLRASCRVAFLGDKDGGFTLVHEDYVPRAHHEVFKRPLVP